MLKLKQDILVLDRGLDEKIEERFAIIQNPKETLVSEAKRHGAEIISESGCAVGGDGEYQNDSVLFFKEGDIVFESDEIGQWLLENGFAEKQN
jgi:hypothetical protein